MRMSNPTKINPVAYFCAEYGLASNLPIFAGGLGVLAADTIREAADRDYPMVALGLLYRGCGSKQGVDESGMQYEEDQEFDPVSSGLEHVFVNDSDQPLFVKIRLTEKEVWARVWKMSIKKLDLYLLDTDTDQNEAQERGIACALYSGGNDFLLKQQLILGIGGVKVLHALGITPTVYHVNEGRPAFLYWQLIRQYMDHEQLPYKEAQAKARKHIVYTNHTLVKAGNNEYDISLLARYAQYYADKMGITIEQLLDPGIDPENGSFGMTQFALNTSSKASAVSQIHYDLSKNLWPSYNWTGITNGVHFPTWKDQAITESVTDPASLWQAHQYNKQQLAAYVQLRTGYSYDPNRLVITWARRIATYKRPEALFSDIERLKRIIMHVDRPVQILLSGKAHIKDIGAKSLLQTIIGYMQKELAGHALYITNYDLELAKHLVRGSDVWLNTPIYGKEASGTSGMKAASNGVLQLTVEDGWAAEVDWYASGWTLDSENLPATLYLRLEDDIAPLYFDRDEQGVPQAWVKKMQHTIAIADQFSTARMLDEYHQYLYTSSE